MNNSFMKSHKFLILLGLLLSIASLFLTTACGRLDGKLRFGVGERGSVTERLSVELASHYSKEYQQGMPVIKNTRAGVSALRLLNGDLLSLALVPAPVVSDYFNHRKHFASEEQIINYVAVASVAQDICHVLVPKDSDVKHIWDLVGKRVALDKEGSETYESARLLLETAGLKLNKITPLYLDEDQSIAALKEGRVDGIFICEPQPSAKIASLCKEMELKFISIEDLDLRIIRVDNDGYRVQNIPGGTYQGQSEPVKALSCDLVLMASPGVAASVIENYTRLILKNFYLNKLNSEDPRYQKQLKAQLALAALQETRVPFHQAAQRVFEEYKADLKFLNWKGSLVRGLKIRE
ncbi:MAG: TAXI family TRAP transporter solute-binding subunit [Succinivibrio sp.]|nr:TAXI family TRAP transporter solute-binding subunit [Succinivibrio sp.]